MTTRTPTWIRVASFWVPGEPVGQPRHRSTSTGRMYTPNPKRKDGSRPVAAWRDAIAAHATTPTDPLAPPIRVDMTFFLPRPKRLMTKLSTLDPLPHTSKPDIDNLTKLVLDVMTRKEWWRDDAVVCEGLYSKYYHAKDMPPGAYIVVYRLADEQQAERDSRTKVTIQEQDDAESTAGD